MNNQEFQVTSTSIETGVTFLEASAGTGKTFTISKLVVRLIAEKGLTISNILVMTFTEAATRELKDRIRTAIQETLLGLTQPDKPDLLAQFYLDNRKDIAEVTKRLRTALATFDEAAIFTIHGFCHRILSEYAFEGNRLFEAKLIKDPNPLWRETIHDYWRSQFYAADGFIHSIIQHQRQTPGAILKELLITNRHPSLEVLPSISRSNYEGSLDDLKEIWQELKRSFEVEKPTIIKLLEDGQVFKKKLRDLIPDLLRTIQGTIPSTPTAPWLDAISALDLTFMRDQLMQKYKETPIELSFFEHCESWNYSASRFTHQHLFFCIDWARESFSRTKAAENLLTFDDLLPAILNTLETESGSRLQARIQGTYTAALIDEFQDTDPQQTELFRRLFVSPEHYLYLIGDPKQAIYRFRGADLFSYLEARSLAKRIYTLSKNWRSEPSLIEGVNGLFSLRESPFLFEDISFLRSTAALKDGNLIVDGQRLESPLKFCYLDSIDDKALTNQNTKKTIRSAVTQEILKWLNGSAQLNGRAVEPSDIAILTRSNHEAHEVREELTTNSIPCVIYSDQTVFETHDAEKFRILLNCLLEPGRIEWIRGLYISSWFNWSAQQVAVHDWLDIQERFFDLHRQWKESGILTALDAWISWSKIKPTLLSQPSGERSLTNLLHLVELASKAEQESKLSPSPLLQWVEQSISDPDKERDDFITRLESDDRAVQIVTIHKSKGLQYPIVFVPFAWNAPQLRTNDAWIYHRQQSENRLVYDNRAEPDEEDALQFSREELSDAVRLLYVALTRAESCCYLFWGNLKNQERSSIGHLLGLGDLLDIPKYKDPAEALAALESQALDGVDILDVENMVHQPSVEYNRFDETEKLSYLTLSNRPKRGFQISSFSSLATGFKEAIEDTLVEDEETESSVAHTDGELSIFTLPKGTVAGNLIHDVLELCEFTSPDSLTSAVKQIGQSSTIGDEWLPVVKAHLQLILDTPLPGPNGDISLNQLPKTQCRKESEFHFPTRTTSTKNLLSYFNDIDNHLFASSLPDIELWSDYRLDGFLRGFIDLLFEWKGKYYILDWKSNWLGNDPKDYDQEAMTAAIAHHAYFLQYYIYTLAAVRYLQIRVPDFDYETHFGGVYYLFVRGIDPSNPGSGVYFDRPNQSSIQKLDKLFQKS